MRRATLSLAGLALALAGCATRPQWVMMNPRTGGLVSCEAPDLTGGSGAYLISRACVSACQAHGYRPMPGAPPSTGSDGTPPSCLN